MEYLKNNVIFADNIKLNFETDAETIVMQLRKDLIENKSKINNDNLVYLYTNNKDKREVFKKKFNIPNYPKPLIMFSGLDLLFGYVESENKWKIFINKNKY